MGIRVVVADDHGVMRAGLRVLIDGQPDMEVVGEVGDAPSVAPLAASARADVVVLDLSMPGGGGLSALPAITAIQPAPRVVVLSMHEQPTYVRECLAAGAHGYVAKRVAGTELLSAIRAAAAGLAAVAAAPSAPAPELEAVDLRALLSRREIEVLERVAAGYTNQQTADHLGLSVKTVEGYRSRVMKKLDVRGRAELVRIALASGLLTEKP